MSHSDVEKLVRERSYELSRKLFQAHVDSRGPGEAAAPVRGADGVERDQERIHERGLTTIFGEIRVKRFGYGAEGADSLHPLDAELNLPRERYSFELRRTAAVEVSKGAFDEAVASLGRHTGAKVGKRQVEELAGVVFYIESRRFLIRDSPRPATTYEQKTGGADGVKGA